MKIELSIFCQRKFLDPIKAGRSLRVPRKIYWHRTTESFVQAQIGDKYAVFDLVSAAERAHERLPEKYWGKPGHSFGTLHPATVKADAGRSLASIGMFSEAQVRLNEAIKALSGADGAMTAWVWLLQAKCMLGARDTDGALSLAAAAVAHEAARSSAWVARYVRDLDRQSRSPRMTVGPLPANELTDLVRQTSGWGAASV